MYFICRNCGEYTRIHKKSNYCWKCGSDKITSADSKVEAEKAKREAVGKQDITAVSGRAKTTTTGNKEVKEILRKQLELLAEVSEQRKNLGISDLCQLTSAITSLAANLVSIPS